MHNGPNVVAAWSCAEEALRVTSRVEGCRAAADRTWHPPAAPEKRDLSKAGSSMSGEGLKLTDLWLSIRASGGRILRAGWYTCMHARGNTASIARSGYRLHEIGNPIPSWISVPS